MTSIKAITIYLGSAYLIGEEEKNSNVLTIKNNITKNEYKIKKEEIVKFIREN